jgi:hypothetical protein
MIRGKTFHAKMTKFSRSNDFRAYYHATSINRNLSFEDKSATSSVEPCVSGGVSRLEHVVVVDREKE